MLSLAFDKHLESGPDAGFPVLRGAAPMGQPFADYAAPLYPRPRRDP